INIETTYVGDDGRPLKTDEYLELLIGILGKFYNDEQGLRDIWSSSTRSSTYKRLDINLSSLFLCSIKTYIKNSIRIKNDYRFKKLRFNSTALGTFKNTRK